MKLAWTFSRLGGVLALSCLAGCGANGSSASSGLSGQLGASPQIIYKTEPLTATQQARLSEEARAEFLSLVSPQVMVDATPPTFPFTVTIRYLKPGAKIGIFGQNFGFPVIVNSLQDAIGPLYTQDWPDQTFNFVGTRPSFQAFEQFIGGQLILGQSGVTITMSNTQTGDSFTLGDDKPSGSNVTFSRDTTTVVNGQTTALTYVGVARFASGWRAVFGKQDSRTFNGSPNNFPDKSDLQLAFAPPSGTNVSFSSFSANPASFNPANNETTQFQAAVVATGFASNATMNWTLTPVNVTTAAPVLFRADASTTPGGGGGSPALPPIFSGSGDISSGVANITQSWNGKSDSGQALTAGDYPYSLNVTVVDSTGLSQAATANTTVALLTAPTMRVDSGEGAQLALAVPTVNQDPLFLKQDNVFKKRVFPYRAGQTAPWNISTSGIQFQLEPGQAAPQKLNVRLESSVSLGNQTFKLDRQSEGKYAGTVALTNALIKPDPENVTTYTTVTAIGSSSLDFIQLMKSSVATEVYPNPRNALGDFLGSMLNPDASARDNLVPPTVENVRSGGFEAVKVSLLKSDNDNKLANDLTTVIYVRHPAKICYVNSHGSHTGVLNLADDYNMLRRSATPPLSTVPPQDLTPGADFSDPNVLDTLILNSCDSLDVYDYNNANLGREGRVLPTDPITLRPAPGLTWHQAMVKDSGHYPALLGFNSPSAEFSEPGLVALWGQELSATKNRVLAWMLANYKTGIGKGANIVPGDIAFSSGFEDASLRAAALDDQFYYYIPCKYLKPEKGNILMPDQPSALGVYRVKLENPIPAEWDAFPPSVAERVIDVNGTIIIR